MAYELKEGQGSLFKNDRKEKDTQPDYRGSIMVNGVECWLSAWIKKGNSKTYMSLSAQPKNDSSGSQYGRQQAGSGSGDAFPSHGGSTRQNGPFDDDGAAGDALDSDIPF